MLSGFRFLQMVGWKVDNVVVEISYGRYKFVFVITFSKTNETLTCKKSHALENFLKVTVYNFNCLENLSRASASVSIDTSWSFSLTFPYVLLVLNYNCVPRLSRVTFRTFLATHLAKNSRDHLKTWNHIYKKLRIPNLGKKTNFNTFILE